MLFAAQLLQPTPLFSYVEKKFIVTVFPWLKISNDEKWAEKSIQTVA